MSRRRRRDDGSHANEERWLITYADMITLLMAFFIMMYSMSVVDLRKFEDLSGAMSTAFGGGTRGASAAQAEGPESLLPGGDGVMRNRAALVNDLHKQIDRSLPAGLKNHVVITHAGGQVTVSLVADEITFPAGTAQLTVPARTILTAIGQTLEQAGVVMRVEGHTCNQPIATERFPSNWELSAERASVVMTHLIRRCGVDPIRISSAAFADTRPIADNDTGEGRVRNRRVDIVVLAAPGDGFPDQAGSGVGEADAIGEAARPRTIRLCPPVDLRSMDAVTMSARREDSRCE